MRFVSISDLRQKSGKVWKTLPGEGEMIITRKGRPVAILAAVNESNLEESLLGLPPGTRRRGGGKSSAAVGGTGNRPDLDERD